MVKRFLFHPVGRILFSLLFVFSSFGIVIGIGWNKTDPAFYSVDEPISQNEKDVLFFSNAINSKESISHPFGIAVDRKGVLYTGSSDGNIYKIKSDGSVERFAKTSGQPLGLAFDGKENLVACISGVGLAFYDSNGKENILVREDEQGNALENLYGLDIGSDGTVYFTEVSRKFSYRDSYLEELESQPNGRILSYNPKSQIVSVLLEEVYHPTGIALSGAEDYLIYGEKYRHRITRLWLKGEKKGKDRFFITHLAGSPALILTDKESNFWVALSSPRHVLIDKIQDKPILKRILASFPAILGPSEGELAYAISLDKNGDVNLALVDRTSDILGSITAVSEYGSGLLLVGNTEGKIWKWKFQTLESFF